MAFFHWLVGRGWVVAVIVSYCLILCALGNFKDTLGIIIDEIFLEIEKCYKKIFCIE